MMRVGKRYLLFLRRVESGGSVYYVSSGVNYGTISLEEDGRDEVRYGENGKQGDFSQYKSWWDEAKKKYISE
mgnify:CR=1 FL=1